MEAVLKFKGNSVILDYEYGLYEYVEIEIEDKLEKYWADVKTVYLKEAEENFFRSWNLGRIFAIFWWWMQDGGIWYGI